MQLKKYLFIFLLLGAFVPLNAQNYDFDDFVGTWNGTIELSYSGGPVPITMIIEPDGFYTETSGYLMPTIYPNTQQCDYEASTNRFHWWFVNTVYAGQSFYTHHFYEIVSFDGNSWELHYNFWDDPMPHPEQGIILLEKEGGASNDYPEPSGLEASQGYGKIDLSWDAPQGGSNLQGYDIYYSYEGGAYEWLDFTGDTYLSHQTSMPGEYNYYVIAQYAQNESDPSNTETIFIDAELMPAAYLDADIFQTTAYLNWQQDYSQTGFPGSFYGYEIYQSTDGYSYSYVGFSAQESFEQELTEPNTFYYYVIAQYEEGDAEPSEVVTIDVSAQTPAVPYLSSAYDEDVTITIAWEEPMVTNGFQAEITGYQVFHRVNDDSFAMLDEVGSPYFNHTIDMTGAHQYYIVAVYTDEYAQASPISTSVVEGQTAAPGGLTSWYSDKQINLSWEVPVVDAGIMSDLEGYVVFVSHDGGSFEELDFAAQENFTHNLQGPGQYQYYVEAIFEGNQRIASTQVSETVLAQTPAPGMLTSNYMDRQIDLGWSAPVVEEGFLGALEGYNIYYKKDGGDYMLLTSTDLETYTHELTGPGSYSYSVSAVYTEGESAMSEITEEMVLAQTPAPELLTSTYMDRQIDLSWSVPAVEDGFLGVIEGYNIFYRKDEGDYMLLTTTDMQSYTHELTGPGSYSYSVSAVYAEGESPMSVITEEMVDAQTPAPNTLMANLEGTDVNLDWETPMVEEGFMDNLVGYAVYHSYDDGGFEYLETVEENGFTVSLAGEPGLHSFYITAVYENGESVATDIVDVELILSAVIDADLIDLQVYPNPASDYLVVKAGEAIQNYRILDSWGRVVQNAYVNDYTSRLSIHHLTTGTYVLTLETKTGAVSKRFLVQ